LPKSRTTTITTQTSTTTTTTISPEGKKTTRHKSVQKELKIQTTFENEEEQSGTMNKEYGAEKTAMSPFELMQVHFWDQEDEQDEDHYHHIGGRVLDAVLVSVNSIGLIITTFVFDSLLIFTYSKFVISIVMALR
jgi:hypothetical protein